ncbi:MAG: hypothetical protein K0R67_2411 [Paenibacillus sp.]|jgi:UPF0716 protein FxsA|nr:hypothetical protein [Paenibacillus sp.]
MQRIILLLFIVIPALELVGLFAMGSLIGGWTTFGLIVLSGVIGALLARRETRKVWRSAQEQLRLGQVPGQTILDGICVLVGGILLLMPGFLSDLLGILLVLPFTRPFFRLQLLGWIRNKLAKGGSITFFRM